MAVRQFVGSQSSRHIAAICHSESTRLGPAPYMHVFSQRHQLDLIVVAQGFGLTIAERADTQLNKLVLVGEVLGLFEFQATPGDGSQ